MDSLVVISQLCYMLSLNQGSEHWRFYRGVRKVSVMTSMFREQTEPKKKYENMSLFVKTLGSFHEQGLHHVFGTLEQVYTLYLTIPVTTASAEHSFSTLRQLKSYLRTTMTDATVSNLTILQIEKAHEINVSKIIEQNAIHCLLRQIYLVFLITCSLYQSCLIVNMMST